VALYLRAPTLPFAEYVIPVLFSPPTRFAGRAIGSVLGRLGMKANANVRGFGGGMESLGDPGKRRAFVHTARSVIDPRGAAGRRA